MPSVLHPDPFEPVLLTTPTSVVTFEQMGLIKKVLEKSSSDSNFANRAYVAIVKILVGKAGEPPVVASLSPSSAKVGDPSFTLRVIGSNFKNTDKIVFNGGEEPTTFVSAGELTTGVNMTTVGIPIVVPVAVLSAAGVLSDPKSFEFTAPALRAVEKKPETQVSQFADKKELTEADFKHPLEKK